MKALKLAIALFFIVSFGQVSAQTPGIYYNTGANQFIDGKQQLAVNTLKEGISRFPNNAELKSLLERITEEQEQNQDQQNQDQQNQDQQDQQNENQENEDQNQENQEGEDQESQDDKGKEGEEEGEKESEEQKEGKEGEEEEAKQEDQQQGEEGEEGEKDSDDKSMPPSTSDKLKEMNISEEKAQMILEAMKNNEVQYLQQRQRKATERPDSDKPDW